MRQRREQAGFAHLAVVLLVVVVAALLIAVQLGSPSSRPATTPSDQRVAARDGSRVAIGPIARTVAGTLVDIRADLSGGRGKVAGTGMVLSATGSILTNNHVIANASAITAQVGGVGPRYDARVVGYDVHDDIALLQLDGAHGLTVAPVNATADVRVGDGMVVIGNAQGLGGTPRATGGAVAALEQRVTATDAQGFDREALSHMIEVTAPVEPGDSGGALVDAQQHVVGLITAATTGGADANGGTGFAIPIGRALAVVDEMRTGHSSATVHVGPRAVLGVAIKSPLSTLLKGAVVGLVNLDSPARAAGLQANDIIVSADGHAVASADDLNSTLDGRRPGDAVTLGWTDTDGHFRTASVRLIVGPPL